MSRFCEKDMSFVHKVVPRERTAKKTSQSTHLTAVMVTEPSPRPTDKACYHVTQLARCKVDASGNTWKRECLGAQSGAHMLKAFIMEIRITKISMKDLCPLKTDRTWNFRT